MALELFFEVLVLGLRNLWRNRLRSFLTMLGMIFGVGSVIAMLSVGAGARSQILARIQELGVRNIIINSVKPPQENKPDESESSWKDVYGLTFDDADYLEQVFSSVDLVHRVNRSRTRAWYQGRRTEAHVLGVAPEYLELFNLDVARGRPFEAIDLEQHAKVCLVRSSLIRELDILEDPVGLWLHLGEYPFEIIGILEDQELRSHTRKALALDGRIQEVYVPYSTSMRTFGIFDYVSRGGSRDASEVELDQVVVEVASIDEVMLTAEMITTALGTLHERKDWEVVIPLELLRQSEETQKVFHFVMLLIATISLIVGGIGIANIMLATITERTREIGIRRALGARRRDVAVQFLTETVVIALIGGLFGCLFGVLGSRGITEWTNWRSEVEPHYVLVALSISCTVGVLFGLWPARRAARMDPIGALRHE